VTSGRATARIVTALAWAGIKEAIRPAAVSFASSQPDHFATTCRKEIGMSRFQLLNRSRQSTEFSCGPSAVRAVLNYWGRDVDEATLMKMMETNSEVGTHPENIVKGIQALGLQAEMKMNVTVDELQEFTASGNPVITLGQVWRSSDGKAVSVEDDWDSGHYIVVLGADKDNVYFQDPYIRMGKGFAPRKAFEAHWHQAMGGDLSQPKLIHLAIFIKGDKPMETQSESKALSSIDFSRFGSINMLVARFPGSFLPFDFMHELSDLWTSEFVRPATFILIRKDSEGRLSAIEGGRLEDDEDVAGINAVLGRVAEQAVSGSLLVRSNTEAAVRVAAKTDFGLSTSDLNKIGDRLAPDSSAIVLMMENTWERRFKEVAGRYGGAVVNQKMITSDAIVRFGRSLHAGESTAHL
jgi:predicted double-glycine peptidase